MRYVDFEGYLSEARKAVAAASVMLYEAGKACGGRS